MAEFFAVQQLLAYLAAQNLAEHRPGQIVHRHNLARHLIAGHARIAVLAQRMFINRVPLSGNHGGDHHLSPAGLRDAHDRRIRHGIVLFQGGFHFGG